MASLAAPGGPQRGSLWDVAVSVMMIEQRLRDVLIGRAVGGPSGRGYSRLDAPGVGVGVAAQSAEASSVSVPSGMRESDPSPRSSTAVAVPSTRDTTPTSGRSTAVTSPS